MRKTKTRVSRLKMFLFIIIIFIAIIAYIKNNYKIVCIDAGHGGKDVREYIKQ